MSTLEVGQEVEVYFNLNTHKWSVRTKVNGKWRVTAHVEADIVAKLKALEKSA